MDPVIGMRDTSHRIARTTIGVEPFDTGYGGGFQVQIDSAEAMACELVEDDGVFRRHPPPQAERPRRLAFVDGTMRVEARLTRTDTQGTVTGLAGSWGAGAVLAAGDQPLRFALITVGRAAIFSAGQRVELQPEPGGWSWEADSITGTELEAARDRMRRRMRDTEADIAEPGVVPDRADSLPARRARLEPRRHLRPRRGHLPGRADRLHRPARAGWLDLRHQRQVAPRQQRPAAARIQPLVRAREGGRRIQRRADDPRRRTVQRPRIRDQRDHRRWPGIHRPPRRRCGAVLPERALHRPAQPVDRPPPGDRRQLRRLSVRLLPAGGAAPVGQLAHRQLPWQPRHAQGLPAGIPAGPNELYDLTTDPDERTNRIDDPAQQRRIRDLRGLLEEWFAEQVSADKDGRTLPVGGGGQLRPVGPAWEDGSPAFTANDCPPSAWWRDK